MLLRKRRRGAVEPGLGMRDQLDRYRRHQIAEPSLGDEALAEARLQQMVLEPQPQTARDHHPARPMRQREIARDRAEAEAEAVHRRHRDAVLALEREVPDLL